MLVLWFPYIKSYSYSLSCQEPGVNLREVLLEVLWIEKLKRYLLKRQLYDLNLAKAGIKTCVNAPSAKILTKKIWKFKCNKEIYHCRHLHQGLMLLSKSLKNPKILEIKIPKLFVKIALNICYFRIVN